MAGSDNWLMELFGEVMTLLRALEDHGHDIEGYQAEDASHPIVTSRFRLAGRAWPYVRLPLTRGNRSGDPLVKETLRHAPFGEATAATETLGCSRSS